MGLQRLTTEFTADPAAGLPVLRALASKFTDANNQTNLNRSRIFLTFGQRGDLI